VVLAATMLLSATELALRIRYRWRVLPRGGAAPGQITVVALGDSIVAGTPGEAEDAWPARLAERLRVGYPGVVWRVLNAGVPGDTAPQGYARFDRDVAAVGPQIVLIAFGLNDCNPARYGLDRWREAQVPRGLARSYLWQAARARVVRWGRQTGRLAGPEPEPEPQPFPRTSPHGFANTLDTLVARARMIGAQPVLLTMTPLATAAIAEVQARDVPYPLYNEIIRACATRNRVPLVELALAPGVPADAFEPDGLHLTASGQAWVAEQIFAQLDRAGLWSARVGR